MPRFRNIGYLENRPLSGDLDAGFVGMNDRLSPALLRAGAAYYDVNRELSAPGLYSAGHNVRCQSGEVATRPGCHEVLQFNPTSLTEAYGAGRFSDPVSGNDRLAVACWDGLWVLGGDSTPYKVDYPGDGTALPDPAVPGDMADRHIDVVQAFDEVFLFRGADLPAWVWDGKASSPVRVVADVVPTFGGDDYTDAMPDAAWGVVVANRLVAPLGRDQLAVSEIDDFTRWDRALSTFRVQGGEAGSIVAAAPYRRTRLVVFKEHSTYVLTGVDGDLSAIALEGINDEVGCAARRSVAAVGGDILWLGHGGVYRLSEVVELGMVAQEVPVSDDISATFARVNWEHAHKAAGAVHGRYYYLSVPLDGATDPSYVLVYDTVSRQWQGYDTVGPATAPVRDFHYWAKTLYLGRETLLGVDRSGYVLAYAHGGDRDHYPHTAQREIESSVTTRGYVFGDMGFKVPRSVTLSLAQRGATFTVDAITDGVAEEAALVSGRTFDRTASRLHGVAARASDNSGDDFSAPGREDYSWVAGDGEEPQSGIRLGLLQTYQHRYPCRGRTGRWVAFRVSSSTGHFRLQSLHADAHGAGHHTATAS